ncbi:uncharacterized protein LOC111018269 [Momordica charantia]|uniref:Uncharacterized protein LOC111018269 n=1 Tax=Momordica charantia TaxID=3673 RepID=A0A6J1D9H5_MOMCH|nr:uncharacterized protein LOC111018269 [Momordica charantia]
MTLPMLNPIKVNRCTVNGKICNIIIDNGSTENVIFNKLVTPFNLKVSLHPSPYKVSWIKKGGKVMVNTICIVPLSIGTSYKDQITCVVIDMDVCHIFLGRPWQYDTQALHKGSENTYEFSWMGKTVVLLPLQSQQEATTAAKGHLFHVCSGKHFLLHRSEHLLALVIKDFTSGEGIQTPEVHPNVQTFLDTFPELLNQQDSLPPLRDIQHRIDLLPGATLPNLPHYKMSPTEYKILHDHITELRQKGISSQV